MLETNKSKRIYNLPKYIYFHKSCSHDDKNVFQTSLRVNGKMINNSFNTVKEAIIWNVTEMLKYPEIWSFDKISNYLKTYKPEMEEYDFVNNDGARENDINFITSQISQKLSDIMAFAEKRDISIKINVE